MMRLKVFENLGQAMALYEELGDKLAPDMAKALNRAAHGVKTDVSRVIPATRGVSKEEVKDWKFKTAKPDDIEAFATIAGKRLGMESFIASPRPWSPTPAKGGLSIDFLGRSHRFRHAFMGLKTTDPVRVLERETGDNPKSKNKDPRYRLKHLTTVAVPQMADDDDVVAIVSQKAAERFLKQFDHLMDRLIKDFA